MFNVSETQKKVLSIWAIIGVVILLIVILVSTITPKDKKDNSINNLTSEDSNVIIDRNRYYTVKNAILKYYSYVNMEDYSSVLAILDEAYIKDNNITLNNVTDYLTDTKVALSYQSKVMCLKSVKKSVYRFVIEGEEISANTGSVIASKYYEVALDGNNSRFSLMPIDAKQYNEVCNGSR